MLAGKSGRPAKQECKPTSNFVGGLRIPHATRRRASLVESVRDGGPVPEEDDNGQGERESGRR